MPNPPQPGSYRIDAEQSTVAFVSRHMLTKVRGRFLSFEGVIVVRDPIETSGVDVHIEAESITTASVSATSTGSPDCRAAASATR